MPVCLGPFLGALSSGYAFVLHRMEGATIRGEYIEYSTTHIEYNYVNGKCTHISTNIGTAGIRASLNAFKFKLMFTFTA